MNRQVIGSRPNRRPRFRRDTYELRQSLPMPWVRERLPNCMSDEYGSLTPSKAPICNPEGHAHFFGHGSDHLANPGWARWAAATPGKSFECPAACWRMPARRLSRKNPLREGVHRQPISAQSLASNPYLSAFDFAILCDLLKP